MGEASKTELWYNKDVAVCAKHIHGFISEWTRFKGQLPTWSLPTWLLLSFLILKTPVLETPQLWEKKGCYDFSKNKNNTWIHEQIPIKNIYIYLAFSFNKKCVQFIDYLIILTTILRKLICYPEHPLKVLFKGIQETLVHAPKLWAEEISKRASLFP